MKMIMHENRIFNSKIDKDESEFVKNTLSPHYCCSKSKGKKLFSIFNYLFIPIGVIILIIAILFGNNNCGDEYKYDFNNTSNTNFLVVGVNKAKKKTFFGIYTKGAFICIDAKDTFGNSYKFSIKYPEIGDDVRIGDSIVIDKGIHLYRNRLLVE